MQLKRLVNDKSLWDSFVEEINTRIGEAHKTLENTYGDDQAMYRAQGKAQALRQLLQLREKLNNE